MGQQHDHDERVLPGVGSLVRDEGAGADQPVALRLPDIPLGIRTLSNTQSAWLDTQYPSAKTPDNCVTCKGEGTFRWFDATRTSVCTYECSCVDQWVLHRYLLWSGIGIHYQRMAWADLHNQALASSTEAWLAKVEKYMDAGLGLLMTGSKGTGKTLVAVLALKHLLGKGHSGYFTTFNGLLSVYTGSWRDPEEKRRFHSHIKNTPLLVIDDLGKENRGADFPKAAFDEVLRHRVAQGAPTIITTNDDSERLASAYGGFVASLLSEHVVVHEVTGEDFRPLRLEMITAESDLGLRRPIVVG